MPPGPCPLRPGHDKALGWFGPFLVGAAAGLSIFVGIEGVLGLKVEEAVTNPAGWVRLAALGTVAGYLGMVMLDSVSIAFARTLLQRGKDYIRETEQLHLQAESSKAILIADKFREMKHYDEALTKLDEAHVKDPSNAQIVIHKALVFAAKGDDASGDEKTEHFKRAYRLTDAAARMDADRFSRARAIYDRACFALLAYPEKKEIVLRDLRDAVEPDERLAELARYDRDFQALQQALQQDTEFRSITGQKAAPTTP